MEPQSELRRRLVKPNSGIIIGTGLLLIIAFFALILLFFLVSSLTPTLVGKCVAVVDINQPLSVDGSSSSLFSDGVAGSEQIAKTIGDLNKRDDVGAVVIVFNSPGGSVVATREIYQSIKELNKPSVAYFREVAASGAYYAATGTDYIISDPDALTGSIGVIATFTEMQGLFNKLGLNVTVVKSAQHKDIGSPYRNMTAEEYEIMQVLINEVYDEFKSVVIENRGSKLVMSQFQNITDGRIMSGRQALKVGLVDQLGNKKDAIMKAAELSGIEATSIDDVRVCPAPTMVSQSGLLGLDSFIQKLQTISSTPQLSYK